jgi:predicted phage tail protein|tara:strand:+ start:664 stop:3912 length:3249 start_codon:yes stop_codon:yes gene_type:complete
MTKIIGSGGEGKGGGGGGGTPTEAKDNLDSKQFAKVLDLIGEGEIGGLVDGAKSIFLNNTPLQAADGTFNFKDVTFETRTGTSSQTNIPITKNVETTKSTGFSTVLKATPKVIQITDSDVDAVSVTITVPALQRFSDEGDIFGTEVKLEIAVQYSGGSYSTVVSGNAGTITGRTPDTYQRDYLINLDGAFPVNIKVTRITADSSSSKLANEIQFNSYVEIKYDQRTYPNSALVGLKVDAEQFSSIPTRKYLVKGIKVKIPHNATVRADGSLSYTGTFNGTLGAAQYTNDPAWCLYDLLSSSRYGLGAHLVEADLDKFSFYQASVYCSTQIDDGTGTGNTEPRFSCNVSIQNQQEAYNVINQMCSVFRAMPYYQVGSLTITQDSPKDSSYLFTLANTLPPGFTYSNTSQKTRPTVVVAKYLDLELRDINYEEVVDTANQARYGSIVKNINAFACTSRGQANRLAKWLLYMENVEREVVTFATSIDAGVVVRPGQIVEIADPVRSGERRGGRIKAATTNSVTVDNTTNLTYKIGATLSAILPDGSVENKTVTSIVNDVVNLGQHFSSAPNVNSVWVYQTNDILTSTWRVLEVKEENRSNYTIVASQYNSGKYNHIESGIALTPRDVTNLDVAPASPTGITAEEVIYENTGIARVKIIVSWTTSTDNVYVRWRYEQGNYVSRTVEGAKSYEILDTIAGNYTIEVYSVSASGLRSTLPNSLNPFVAVGKTALPTNVSGVSLLPIDQSSAILSWNRATELDVLLGGKTLIRHSSLTTGAQWKDAQEIVVAAAGNQTQKIVPLLEGTYLIKFEDDGGRQSPAPGSQDSDWNNTRVTTNLPAPQERLVVGSIDEHTANFTGSKTNTVYDSALDALTLTVTSNATATSGEYLFSNSIDLTQPYDVNLRKTLKASNFILNSLWDDRTDLIDTWGYIDAIGGLTEATACNAALYVRATNDDPAGSPTWSAYKEFSNVLITGRAFQFKAILTSNDTNQNIAITQLGATLELQGRTESISTPVTTGSSQYTVSFTNPFKNTPQVVVTPTTQQSGDFFELANISRTGFQVTFKNGSSAVARSFVWAASGFGKEVT